MAKNVGILAMDIYFPPTCIQQFACEVKGKNGKECWNSRHGYLLPSYLYSAGLVSWSKLCLLFCSLTNILQQKKIEEGRMDMGNWVRDLINFLGGSYIFKPKVVNVLFLGNDESCKTAVISSLSDKNVEPAPYSTSWVSSIGNITFNFFDLGRPRIAHAVWRDYGAKMDAVVYIVDATTDSNEQFLEARRDLNDLLSDEAFANLPFLILCTTQSFDYSECMLSLVLNLTHVTTGKGLLDLAIANAQPLKVLVAEKYNTKEYLCGFKWLSMFM